MNRVQEYAQALLAIAQENNLLDNFLKQSEMVLHVVDDYPDLIKIFTNSKISHKQKNQVIDETFSSFDKYFVNGLKVMVARHDFKLIRAIFKSLIVMICEKLGITQGIVYSSQKLNQHQIDKITQKLAKHHSQLKLVNLIDQSLIGGIKVVVKDQIYDNSLLYQLRTLQNNL